MSNKISFNINNSDKQIWEQSEHDGSVKLYGLVVIGNIHDNPELLTEESNG